MWIYSNSGARKADVLVTNDAKWKKTLGGDDYITLVFRLKESMFFDIGDYIVYNGERFYITKSQSVTYEESTDGYKYELQFDAYYKMWGNKIMMFVPDSSARETSFSLTTTIGNHVSLVLSNLAYHGFHYNDDDFVCHISENKKEIRDYREAKNVQYDSTSILDALTKISEAWECEWWVSGNVICFGKNSFGEQVEFKLGRNVASMGNTKSQQDYATRIYAFGSTNNIPDYYRKDLFFSPTPKAKSQGYMPITDDNKKLKAKYFRSKAYSNGVTYTSSVMDNLKGESELKGKGLGDMVIRVPLASSLRKGTYTFVPQEGLFGFVLESDGSPLDSLELKANITYRKSTTEGGETTDDDADGKLTLSPSVVRVDDSEGVKSSSVTIRSEEEITRVVLGEEVFDFSTHSTGVTYTLSSTHVVCIRIISPTTFELSGSLFVEHIIESEYELGVYSANKSCSLKVYANKEMGAGDSQKDKGEVSSEAILVNLVTDNDSSLVYDGLNNYPTMCKGVFTIEEEVEDVMIVYTISPKEKDNSDVEYSLRGFVNGSIEVRRDKDEDLHFKVVFKESDNPSHLGFFTNRTYDAIFIQETQEVYIKESDILNKTGLSPLSLSSDQSWEIDVEYLFKGKIPSLYYTSVYDEQVVSGVVQKRLMLPKERVRIDKETYEVAGESCTDYFEYDGSGHVDAEADLVMTEIVEKVISLEEVYPMRESNVVHVSTRVLYDKVENADGTYSREAWNAYRVFVEEQDFDTDFINRGETLQIKFLSGKLSGMTFDAEFISRAEYTDKEGVKRYGQCFEVVRNDTYGRPIPDGTLMPKARKSQTYEGGSVDPDSEDYRGDTFCLLNFNVEYVGTSYIPEAEKRLLGKTYEYVQDSKKDPNNYDCRMLSKPTYDYLMANGGVTQYEIGQKVRLVNGAYFKGGYRDSRIMGFEIHIDKPYDSPTYTIGEEAKYSTLGELKESIENLTIRGTAIDTSIASLEGASSVDIVTSTDTTPLTDYNVLSSRRSANMFLRKDQEEVMNKPITFNDMVFVNGEAFMGVVKVASLRSDTYSNGDNYTGGEGFAMYHSNGKAKIEIDNLLVRNKAIFTELEIRDLNYVGGNMVFSPASSTIEYVERVSETNYKVYIKLEENGVKVGNPWRQGDMFKCETFNLESNKVYGFTIRNVGRDDKGYYIQFVTTNNPLEGSSPEDIAKGDKIVLMGNNNLAQNPNRGNVIVIETMGDDAPCLCFYHNVNNWNLSQFLVKKDSPKGTIQRSGSFLLSTNPSTDNGQPIVMDRGAWESGDYSYYDRVDHNGSLWLCVNLEGTSEEPSASSNDWLEQVKKGSTPTIEGGKWVIDGQEVGKAVGEDGLNPCLESYTGVIGMNYNSGTSKATIIPHFYIGREDCIKDCQVVYDGGGSVVVSTKDGDVSKVGTIESVRFVDFRSAIGGRVKVTITYKGVSYDLYWSFSVTTSELSIEDQEARLVTKAIDSEGNIKEASLGTMVDEGGRTLVKMTGDEIRLEGSVTANGNVKIDQDGTIKAIMGVFENCQVKGFVSGGVFINGEKNLHVKDNLTIFVRQDTNIYLPVDPEYIGAKVKIVVWGYSLNDSGTGLLNKSANEDGFINYHATIRAGRSYNKHCYIMGGGFDENDISTDKNRDSVEGRVKEALFGTQWFYSQESVEVRDKVYAMPNVINMPCGVIELVGIQSLVNGYITKHTYKMDEYGKGTLLFNGSAPIVDGLDKDCDPRDKVFLTQWAIGNVTFMSGTTKISDIVGYESIEIPSMENESSTTTTTTGNP